MATTCQAFHPPAGQWGTEAEGVLCASEAWSRSCLLPALCPVLREWLGSTNTSSEYFV